MLLPQPKFETQMVTLCYPVAKIFKIPVMVTQFLSYPNPKDSDSTNTIVRSWCRDASNNPAQRNLPKTQAPVSGVYSGDVGQTRFVPLKLFCIQLLQFIKNFHLPGPPPTGACHSHVTLNLATVVTVFLNCQTNVVAKQQVD